MKLHLFNNIIDKYFDKYKIDIISYKDVNFLNSNETKLPIIMLIVNNYIKSDIIEYYIKNDPDKFIYFIIIRSCLRNTLQTNNKKLYLTTFVYYFKSIKFIITFKRIRKHIFYQFGFKNYNYRHYITNDLLNEDLYNEYIFLMARYNLKEMIDTFITENIENYLDHTIPNLLLKLIDYKNSKTVIKILKNIDIKHKLNYNRVLLRSIENNDKLVSNYLIKNNLFRIYPDFWVLLYNLEQFDIILKISKQISTEFYKIMKYSIKNKFEVSIKLLFNNFCSYNLDYNK